MFLLALGLALVGAFPQSSAGQTERAREYELKATFLREFVNFIDWPSDAFQSPTDPLRVVIVGSDPFGEVLDRVVAASRSDQRRIVIVRPVVFGNQSLSAKRPAAGILTGNGGVAIDLGTSYGATYAVFTVV